jgi:murein DD-endopeptidase MepM/ murein hydrolase activator NlpD
VSSTSGRHRKPPQYAAPSPRRHRHRKPSPVTSALKTQPTRVAAAVAGSALLVTAGPAVSQLPALSSRPAALAQADMFRSSLNAAHARVTAGLRAGSGPLPSAASRDAALGSLAGASSQTSLPSVKPALTARTVRHSAAPAAPPPPPGYRNPLRDVSGLLAERVDMGVDFGGSGPVYALGDGVVTNAQGNNAGWPGGGWITYQLTDGPDAGKMVFLAEDVTPQVQVGQHVTTGTVIATMYNGGDGIETGWAMADGASAESQLAEAGGISGGGPFPTMIGMNFDAMLQSLGVPAGNNAADAASGILPAGYPSWG